MTRGLMPIALLAVFVASDACPKQAWGMEYAGICEASAGAFIDATHFVVASDETNRLRIYERGEPEPIGSGRHGELHLLRQVRSRGRRTDRRPGLLDQLALVQQPGRGQAQAQGVLRDEDRAGDGKPTLTGVGHPVGSLRDAIATAAEVEQSALNIEALAATPEGGLLIGLRAPLRRRARDRRAVPEPGRVIDHPVEPEFGEA